MRTRQKQIPRACLPMAGKAALGMTRLGFGLAILWWSLSAQPANAQGTYKLKPTPKTVAWGYYAEAKAARVLRASHP
jgi:hypothetical protein